MTRKKSIGQRKKFYRTTVLPLKKLKKKKKLLSLLQWTSWHDLDHEEFGFETFEDMYEYVLDELNQKQMPTKGAGPKPDPANSLVPPNKKIPPKGKRAGGMHYPLGTNKAGGVKEDSRRTDDAIDAYDKSKDASRDADWDTEHGKKKKGDKEKKYAKKERGEIDKDDPEWYHQVKVTLVCTVKPKRLVL